MIFVKYEEYYNDYIRKQNLVERFLSLETFKHWVEFNTVGDTNDERTLWWPHYKESNYFTYKIQNGWKVCIRMIVNEEGIIFTDGFYTSGKRHSSNEFYKWCQERIQQQQQQQKKQYDFVE